MDPHEEGKEEKEEDAFGLLCKCAFGVFSYLAFLFELLTKASGAVVPTVAVEAVRLSKEVAAVVAVAVAMVLVELHRCSMKMRRIFGSHRLVSEDFDCDCDYD